MARRKAKMQPPFEGPVVGFGGIKEAVIRLAVGQYAPKVLAMVQRKADYYLGTADGREEVVQMIVKAMEES